MFTLLRMKSMYSGLWYCDISSAVARWGRNISISRNSWYDSTYNNKQSSYSALSEHRPALQLSNCCQVHHQTDNELPMNVSMQACVASWDVQFHSDGVQPLGRRSKQPFSSPSCHQGPLSNVLCPRWRQSPTLPRTPRRLQYRTSEPETLKGSRKH